MPWRPASTGRPARASSALADLRLPAARRAAAAVRPSGLSVMWPTSPAKPEAPDTSRPSSTTPAADADLARDVHHVVDALGHPAAELAQDAGVGVVEDVDRHGGRERPRQAAGERDVDPAEVGGHRHDTVVSADDARDRHADPDDRDVDPARSSLASCARSATTSSTDSSPRGRWTRTLSMVSPPRPTIAAAIESTKISRLSTAAPVGTRRTSGEGRPGVPSRTAGASVTKPAAASSPTSERIALRVSPVDATRSERDSGPRSWRPRTIAERFARRTVSLRCPMSEPSTSKVCDPFRRNRCQTATRRPLCQARRKPT